MRMKSRVLVLSNQIPHFPGPGAETRAYCLSRILSRSYDLTFLLPDYGPTYRGYYEALGMIGEVKVFRPDRQWKMLEWRLNQVRTRLERSRLFQAVDGTPEMLRSIQSLVYPLREHMRGVNWTDFDLFHIIHPHFAGLIKTLPIPIPRTLDWVDERTIVLRRQQNTSSSLLDNIALRKEIGNVEAYQRDIISAFDASFVASDVDADRLEQIAGGRRPLVVPNGVDVDYFVNPTPKRPLGNTIIFTGHMGYRPNEDAVVYFVRQILPMIRAQLPDTRFTIVGTGPSVTVRGLQDEYPEVVKVTGEVPDVRPFLAQAAVSVAPLLNGGGTRLKLLEAMAMHRPVVTTPVGCEGLAIEDNFHAIVRSDPVEFAKATIEVLCDQMLWIRLVNNGYRLVSSEYGWEKAAEPILETWDYLLSSTPSTQQSAGMKQ